MVGNEIFLKQGFEIVDTAQQDFDLLVLKFKVNVPLLRFKNNWDKKIAKYKKGLTIIRAEQYPYTKKNVNEIVDASKKTYGITSEIIKNKNYEDAQINPCAFGFSCIKYNDEIIFYHLISNKRFTNIMNSILN